MSPKKPKSKTNSRRSQPKSAAIVPTDYAGKATRYANDVLSGEVLACKWVRLACQRHIDDLEKAKKHRYPYFFDEPKANRVCRFIEQLPHTKGDWAARRQKIRLEPWQCFVLCSIFGWMRRDDETRRFRIAYICVPRKNGKSILAGGIGTYMFAADHEFGAEVYSGATSEKQAWEVFRPAKQMVERTPRLKEAFGIYVGAKNMAIVSNGSRFEPVIGKPGDGSSPSCAIVDEYHEHDSDELFDTMRTGMGARRQPLLLGITTAGSNLGGPCHMLQGDVEKVLEGSIQRDELFGIVYTLDPEDDWTSDEANRKANPNYDVSISGDFLRTEQTNAIRDSRKQNVYKTKHQNVWVGASVAWMNMQRWNQLADVQLRADDFKGCPCWIGVDLSSKIDITARVKIFKKRLRRPIKGTGLDVDLVPSDQGPFDDHFYIFGDYYLPEERAMEPEFQHYQKWVHDGYLRTTDGNMIDYALITADTISDIRKYKVAELGYDPWNAEQFAQQIASSTPAKIIAIPQQARHLSDPMKQAEALVMDGRLHHDGNPCMNWMISNVVAHADTNENIKPNKEKEQHKIDGPVAMIIAGSRAFLAAGPVKSIYSTRGLLTL